MKLETLKRKLWEWGNSIPETDYMQIVVPIKGRITSEAQADFIAKYGDRYEFIRIFKMTMTEFGIHFRKAKVQTSVPSLTCDKTKEPPCHLEPSIKLCQKCTLNNSISTKQEEKQ